MSEIAHAERAHSLLGASKASQWINCPPSAVLQESVPEKRSEYADEGTAAHEYAELRLRRRLLPCDAKERKLLDTAMEKFKAENRFYGPEMESAVTDYVETVEERFNEARARSTDAVILFEERLDFSEWTAPDQGGTGDVVIIADGLLEVIDLKYGKGVPVTAVGNPQPRLYGLGAWDKYNWLYDIRDVRMTIIQPRLDSLSSDTMPIGELLDWAESVVRPAAALAIKGEGLFNSGDHCRWCKVKATCRARADKNMEALAYEFRDPALMTNEEIGSILFICEQLAKWAKDVEEYAYGQAVKGEPIPQWKLVEGRSNRKIMDQTAAKEKLLAAGFEAGKILKPQELLALGELETKVVGKKQFTALLGDLIEKPPGKPVLVPETDKRPALNSVDQDFAGEDFSETPT